MCAHIKYIVCLLLLHFPILTLEAPTPQNGQTSWSYANNSSAICRRIMYVCMFHHFVGLVLKGLTTSALAQDTE